MYIQSGMKKSFEWVYSWWMCYSLSSSDSPFMGTVFARDSTRKEVLGPLVVLSSTTTKSPVTQ